MVPFRVALIGCVESTKATLATLLSLRPAGVDCVGLVTRRTSSFNADFFDLAPAAEAAGVAVLFVEECTNDESVSSWLREKSPDLILVVGWSRLLSADMLKIPKLFTIGYHPAALPANRGRHPIVWALALGLRETASTFFVMGEGVDDGPIMHQKPVSIDVEDDARTLYDKLLALIPSQICEIIDGLRSGLLKGVPQSHRLSNCWRKRSAADGCIDWRMSAQSICNLVRALTHPYLGAHFIFNGQEVKVWKCRIEGVSAANIEPGKVLSVEGKTILVKSGDTAVRLLETGLNQLPVPGDYL